MKTKKQCGATYKIEYVVAAAAIIAATITAAGLFETNLKTSTNLATKSFTDELNSLDAGSSTTVGEVDIDSALYCHAELTPSGFNAIASSTCTTAEMEDSLLGKTDSSFTVNSSNINSSADCTQTKNFIFITSENLTSIDFTQNVHYLGDPSSTVYIGENTQTSTYILNYNTDLNLGAAKDIVTSVGTPNTCIEW